MAKINLRGQAIGRFDYRECSWERAQLAGRSVCNSPILKYLTDSQQSIHCEASQQEPFVPVWIFFYPLHM